MRRLLAGAIAITAVAVYGNSGETSEVTLYTRPIVATANSSPQDYLDNWNAALSAYPSAPSGYGDTSLPEFQNVQNQTAIPGGTGANISVFYNITFAVPQSTGIAQWRFKFWVDFGLGGAAFLDGKPVAFNSANLDGSIPLEFMRTLKPGTHNIRIYGQEDCCDGFNDGQFRPPRGAPLVNRHVGNFALTDGWSLK